MKKQWLWDAAVGAIGYPMIEIGWRGRTHAAMALAGACAVLSLRQIRKTPLPLWAQALLGGGAVTLIELGTGLMFNQDHHIWDYRKMPAQLRGQICLPYSLCWCGLSLAALPFMKRPTARPWPARTIAASMRAALRFLRS